MDGIFVELIFLSASDHFCQLECHLKALLTIEAGVTISDVSFLKVMVVDLLSSAFDFCDIFAGKFKMHTAGNSSLFVMDVEELTDFIGDVSKISSFEICAGVEGVAMHRVTAHRTFRTSSLTRFTKFGKYWRILS